MTCRVLELDPGIFHVFIQLFCGSGKGDLCLLLLLHGCKAKRKKGCGAVEQGIKPAASLKKGRNEACFSVLVNCVSIILTTNATTLNNGGEDLQLVLEGIPAGTNNNKGKKGRVLIVCVCVGGVIYCPNHLLNWISDQPPKRHNRTVRAKHRRGAESVEEGMKEAVR